MHRIPGRILLITAAFALFLVPVAAIAAGGFNDVPDDNVFKADIQWLADAGVTKGCNPPANTEFCPGDYVTREQMAAFMRRLAHSQVVDAGTVQGLTALELKGPQGDPGSVGPQGDPGSVGPQGDPGPAGVVTNYLVRNSRHSTHEDFGTVTIAMCDEGDSVLGGGWHNPVGTPTHFSIPAVDGEGNLLQGWMVGGVQAAYALCSAAGG